MIMSSNNDMHDNPPSNYDDDADDPSADPSAGPDPEPEMPNNINTNNPIPGYDLSFRHLKAVILFQSLYRKRLNDIMTLKNKLENITHIIHSMALNLQMNNHLNVITYDYYTECMRMLNNLKDITDELPPVSTKLYSSNNNTTFQNYWDKVCYIEYTCLNLLKNCGCNSIYDALRYIIGINWNIGLRQSLFKVIRFLNSSFQIKTIKIDNFEGTFTADLLPEIRKNLNFSSSLTMKLYGAEIHLPIYGKLLIMRGYFKPDHLNILMNSETYQQKYMTILNEFNAKTHNKLCIKQSTETHNESISTKKSKVIILDPRASNDISNAYKSKYLKILNIRDFLVLSIQEIIELINNKYTEFQKIQSRAYSSLLEEYNNSTIENKVNILTLLLIHEKGHDLAKSVISYQYANSLEQMNQITRQFHWQVNKAYIKLSTNIEKGQIDMNICNTINANTSEASYEDRINAMKCDESVKRRAREKLKELKNSREGNSKAVRYLDTLLSIPFGTYKKEKMLRFLSEFRQELCDFIKGNLNSTDILLPESIISMYKESKIHTANSIGICMDILVKHRNKQLSKSSNSNSNNNDSAREDSKTNLHKSALLTPLIGPLAGPSNIPEFNLNAEFTDIPKSNDPIEAHTSVPVRKTSRASNPDSQTAREDIIYESNLIRSNSDLTLIEHAYNKLNSLINRWDTYKLERRQYMKTVGDKLECIHGQNDAKHKVKQIIGQWINGDMEGGIFGFNGPPGTGKTSLAKEGISSCLLDNDSSTRPFAFISLGGSTNSSFLEGHGYTYVDSKHGRIVDLLIECKCMNPIIYFDELDKVSGTAHGKEIMDLLIHITDPQQNEMFNDKYFDGIKIDLSKALIIFSYNDSELIDPTLMNRITEVKFKPLNKQEKIHIGCNFLLPKILRSVGYTNEEIVFNADIIAYIVESYIYEAGVRTLKEKLYELIREMNIRNLNNENISFPLVVNQDLIDDILEKKNRITLKTIHRRPVIGLVNGLYATTVGIGGITLIQVYDMLSDQKFSLELTGKLGDVMKESVRCAKTISWRILPTVIKNKLIEEWKTNPYGLHIHFPSAGTPKDGPSAGITCCTAVISFLCKLPVRPYIALTGEIDLLGNVRAIGGVLQKIEGAIRAGVKLVLIPKENSTDWEEIKHNYQELTDFRVFEVNNVNEVVKLVLINKENYQFNFDDEQSIDETRKSELNNIMEFIKETDLKFSI